MSGPMKAQPVVPEPVPNAYHISRSTVAGGYVIDETPDASGH